MNWLLFVPIFRRWHDECAAANGVADELRAQLDAAYAELRESHRLHMEDLRKIADHEAQRGTGRNVFSRASSAPNESRPAVAQPPSPRLAREVAWMKAAERIAEVKAAMNETGEVS